MKGVYLRGDLWWFRYQLDGRQVRVPLKTRDRRKAIEAAEAILATPQVKEARSWELELRDYLADRLAKNKMSANAVKARYDVLMRFARETGVHTARSVTLPILRSWYASLADREKPIAEVTAQTYVRWVRTFLSYLAERGRIVQRLGEIEMAQLRSGRRKPFCTAEQVRALKQATNDRRLLFILYCGFDAGLRRGEIAEARPEWFDLRNGLLHLQPSDTWQPKDRDARTIPLTKEFQDFLAVYGLPSPFMLPERPMKRKRAWRYRYDFRRPFEDLMAQLGCEWVTPHTMRRTFASLKVSAGVSLYKVAIWLGDLERVVQDHYGFLIPQDSDIERGM